MGPVDLGAGRTAIAITGGGNHTCAILDNGSVRCWGRGVNGRLGYGNTRNDRRRRNAGLGRAGRPRRGRTAVAITAGGYHTCAILDNGTVRCWGDGGTGQLGYGNNKDIGDNEKPGSVGPVDLGAGRKADRDRAGYSHTCALLDNGKVRCWGPASTASSATATRGRSATTRRPARSDR